jgi:ribonuclease PH
LKLYVVFFVNLLFEEKVMTSSAPSMRPIQVVTNVLSSRCIGSAAAEVGATRVICAVRGPQPLVTEYRGNHGKVACLVHRSPFARKLRRGDSEIDLSRTLQSIAEKVVLLERFPQLMYDVTFEIISSDGADKAVAIVAMSAALAAAGIEQRDLVAGCSAIITGDNRVLLDAEPDAQIDPLQTSVFVAAAVHRGDVCYFEVEGAPRGIEYIKKATQMCTEACALQRDSFAACLAEK